MGVYNPFAELPNSCVLCDSRKKCDLHREYAGRSVSRHPHCPLVEVKAPHGRLIDRDALPYTTWYIENSPPVIEWHIKNAPTVIEAEGKDDG